MYLRGLMCFRVFASGSGRRVRESTTVIDGVKLGTGLTCACSGDVGRIESGQPFTRSCTVGTADGAGLDGCEVGGSEGEGGRAEVALR